MQDPQLFKQLFDSCYNLDFTYQFQILYTYKFYDPEVSNFDSTYQAEIWHTA